MGEGRDSAAMGERRGPTAVGEGREIGCVCGWGVGAAVCERKG